MTALVGLGCCSAAAPTGSRGCGRWCWSAGLVAAGGCCSSPSGCRGRSRVAAARGGARRGAGRAGRVRPADGGRRRTPARSRRPDRPVAAAAFRGGGGPAAACRAVGRRVRRSERRRPARPGRRRSGPDGGPGGGAACSTPVRRRQLVAALRADADAYTWVAAAVGSNNAAGYQLATGEPVMAIGGFNGSDPSPTLAQFQQYVADGKIHYFIGGGGCPRRQRRQPARPGDRQPGWRRTSRRRHGRRRQTVYDLSSGTEAAVTAADRPPAPPVAWAASDRRPCSTSSSRSTTRRPTSSPACGGCTPT